MAVRQLDHLNMSVSSFAASANWYRRVLGFEIVESGYEEGQPWGVLRAGDALLCIYQHPERGTRTDQAMESARIQMIAHFGIRIDDPAAFEEAIKRERVKVDYGGAYRWPHSTAWYIRDPDGYRIEVAYWENDRVSFASAKIEP